MNDDDFHLYEVTFEYDKAEGHRPTGMRVMDRSRLVGRLRGMEPNAKLRIIGPHKKITEQVGLLFFNSLGAPMMEKARMWLACTLLADCFGDEAARRCAGAMVRYFETRFMDTIEQENKITQTDLFVMMTEAQHEHEEHQR